MDNISPIAIAAVLAVSVTACGESQEQKTEKAQKVLIAPYTEKIPRETGRMDPHLFDTKKPAQAKNQ